MSPFLIRLLIVPVSYHTGAHLVRGFLSTCALVVGKDGSSDVTRHALENNVLVLYVNTTLPNTVAVGIQRSNERLDIDVGEVVEVMKRLAAEAGDEDVLHELNKLFIHPSGFGAMRGTGKHPDPSPVDVETERKLGVYLVRAARELGIV
ncbi:MAG: hypothetical protein KatS3mg054_0198 [Chloroflexus sp.]|nr:MAG: hypothetical protein KatS3mg054_0198 [Chloroflexus sp.]